MIGDQPQRPELEHRLKQQRRQQDQHDDRGQPPAPGDGSKGRGDLRPQRHGLLSLVQPGFAETQQDQNGDQRERNGQGSRRNGGAELGDHTTGQGARDQGGALNGSDSSDPLLEQLARPDLLEHRVVDDGVHRAGVHREVDGQHESGTDVGGHLLAEPADQRRQGQGHRRDDQDAASAPAVSEDAGGSL